jgi:hypothetical protein
MARDVLREMHSSAQLASLRRPEKRTEANDFRTLLN